MPITIEIQAKCDKCGEPGPRVDDMTIGNYRDHIRDWGWQAGKKKTLCPECKPKYKDPEGYFQAWAQGVVDSADGRLTIEQVMGSTQGQKMKKRLGIA